MPTHLLFSWYRRWFYSITELKNLFNHCLLISIHKPCFDYSHKRLSYGVPPFSYERCSILSKSSPSYELFKSFLPRCVYLGRFQSAYRPSPILRLALYIWYNTIFSAYTYLSILLPTLDDCILIGIWISCYITSQVVARTKSDDLVARLPVIPAATY